jgi:trk system potassium uptake protein TrkH
MVGVGGMRLFRAETSDWSEKAMPRARDIALRIGLVYVALSCACALAYWAFGMSPFDAINHAMTTLSTGGYSTSDSSMGKYGSPAILWTSIAFMMLGALPFVLYLQSLRFGVLTLLEDEQVRFFVVMVLAIVVVGTMMHVPAPGSSTFEALTAVAFNAVSIITTTGYASADYMLWGDFFIAGFFFLMFTGGCSGSTSGSIKAFRVLIALRLLRVQVNKLVHPNGVFAVKLSGRRIHPEISNALVAFVFAVATTVTIVTIGLAAMGLDFVTALSSAATAVTNVGPGLGPIVGPAGNFSTLPDGAKWLLSVAMLLGRVELFTVIVLFSRAYWRT